MFEIDTATDFRDLLDRFITFLTAKGSAFGLTYSGTGDGTFTGYSGGASSVAETFTITATSATSFDVVGSVSGSIGPATVGTPFSHTKLEFLITAGATAFVSGDEFILSTAPKWTLHRKYQGCTVLATQGNTGLRASQNLVDGKLAADDNRIWYVTGPVTLPQDVEFNLKPDGPPGNKTISEYRMGLMTTTWETYGPSAWDFQYWNGSSWVTLDSQTGITGWGEAEIKSFTIASPVSARRYRIHITATPSPSSRMVLGVVQLIDQATGLDAAFAQTILEAPGNDGASQIFTGIHLFERSDADYFNWEVVAMDGYNAGSSFYAQPGIQRKDYVPLWDSSIPYWFVADGRYAVMAAKISGQYEMATFGLLDPYFTPGQWPFPSFLGGCLCFGEFGFADAFPTWESASWRWSNTSDNHRMPTHSDANEQYPGINPPDLQQYHLRARNLDGSWSGYEASDQDGKGDLEEGTGPRNIIWPYRCGISLLDVNLDGSYHLWPIMLVHSAPNTIGELPGIRAVTGQGAAAEALHREGVVDWLVLPNIYRTDRDDFLAVRLG